MNCNGFILSAGLGTRLKPITDKIPKPLVKVAGKPAIFYALESLQRTGVKSVVINTHHLASKVREGVDAGPWGDMAISYSLESELLGTAGGVKKGASLFPERKTTLVLSSDVILNADLEKIYGFHCQKKSKITIAVKRRADVTGCGILEFDRTGKITRFKEKPTQKDEIFSHYINCSIYIVEPEIFDLIPDGFYDFAHDLFPKLIASGIAFYAYILPPKEDYLLGIDTIELLKKAESDIKKGKLL